MLFLQETRELQEDSKYLTTLFLGTCGMCTPSQVTKYLSIYLFLTQLSDLLVLEVKLEEEDKALLLLSSLPSNYDHLATTIMYGKETLELEDVRQML